MSVGLRGCSRQRDGTCEGPEVPMAVAFGQRQLEWTRKEAEWGDRQRVEAGGGLPAGRARSGLLLLRPHRLQGADW